MKVAKSPKFYFDEVAADRPVRFIEGYLCHYEDKWAGQPFKLLAWQKKMVRDLFGWKRKSDGLRRFREVYIETAKGSGKSPLMTAIGLYMLLADGEEGASIFSAATDFAQANITFGAAKKMIEASPKLARRVELKQFVIRYPKHNGEWAIISGTAEGKHGFRPTCILMDECHEWPNRKLYDNISSNMHKRSQPLLLVATNAGPNKECICWQLHERAVRAMGHDLEDETLYAVINAAPAGCAIDDEKAWKAANPSLGDIVAPESLRIECRKAIKDPSLEPRFRRFYLSQWIQGADKWLDMQAWDRCSRDFSLDEVRGLPCYLALDLSQNDDLSSAARIWVGEQRLYATVRQWMPGAAARKYEDRESTPFTRWAEEGHLHLLASPTVDSLAQARIGKYLIKQTERFDVKELCYDRYKANFVIAACERKGMVCVPIPQTFTGLGNACAELERRLKDGSIWIAPSPVLRWQAANVEVLTDKMGNKRPVKEATKGKYAGRRGCKIDGIMALITGMARAIRHGLDDPKQTQWTGSVEFI